MTQNKIINIQFLRAIAALMVVLYHTSQHYTAAGGKEGLNIFTLVSHIGYAGVDIFFVISGYIMWITTKGKHGIADTGTFVYNRLVRIYLPYWIFLVFMIYYYHHSLENFDLMGSVFLTASPSSKMLLQVAWTLQYELYFYAFFSLLLLVDRKYYLKIFVSVFVLIVAIQSYGIVQHHIYDKDVFNIASTFYTFWTSPYILEFLFGCFVGYFFETYRIHHLYVVIAAIAILIVAGLWYEMNVITGSLAEGYYLPYRILFFGTASMLILALFVELNKRNVIVFPRLSLLVGDASYSLYLGHTVLLLFVYEIGLRDWIKEFGRAQTWMMLMIAFAIVVYSVYHYKFIESPLIQWAKSLRGKIRMKFSRTF